MGSDSPPTGGEANLAEVRPGSPRSLHLTGKHSVSAVFLPVRCKCTSGCGCAGPPMAKCSALCILSLISPTLARVSEQGMSLILIVPQWPSKHWVAEIILQIILLAGKPWLLPIHRDLLSQLYGEIYHLHPDRIALWAWPVRGGT